MATKVRPFSENCNYIYIFYLYAVYHCPKRSPILDYLGVNGKSRGGASGRMESVFKQFATRLHADYL